MADLDKLSSVISGALSSEGWVLDKSFEQDGKVFFRFAFIDIKPEKEPEPEILPPEPSIEPKNIVKLPPEITQVKEVLTELDKGENAEITKEPPTI